MPREIRPSWCGLCHSRCGILLEIEDERVVGVRGNPDSPIGRGRICRRGRLMTDHIDHPDRLDHPLRRVGERGDARWQRVSWVEALDDIAGRLGTLRDRHGPETLAFSRGTARTYHWDARRFLNLFGSPNLTGANPICHCPSVVVETALMGAMPHGDLGRCACMVIWGSARSVSSPITIWAAIHGARKRGAKMIVVDPRRTREAEMADIWLPIRPGADVALMLGWIHVICEEGLWDEDFVQRWTVGFDALRARAQEYPPARVADLTWLPERDIVAAARMYATTAPAVITWGQGVDKLGPNTDAALHARAALRAITGNLDRPGGECFGAPEGHAPVVTPCQLELNHVLGAQQRQRQLGASEHPLFSFEGWERIHAGAEGMPAGYLPRSETAKTVTAHPNAVYRAILTGQPYPVKALIVQAANPVMTLADPERTLAALRSLDLLVVMDYYLTPTAALADYVLPAAATVERDDLWHRGPLLAALPRGIEPRHERRSDYEFWMELGRRMGQAEHWPWDDAEQVCDHRLAPLGISFQDLVEGGPRFAKPRVGRSREFGFATPSGKVELRSSLLPEFGGTALPEHRPLPEPSPEFPLLLITGSGFNPMYHSEQRQWAGARAEWPDPCVSLHPRTAAALGIQAGDWVRIETAVGAIRQRARFVDSLNPRIVGVQHGWWFPEREESDVAPFACLESNANVLVRDDANHCGSGTGAWQQTAIPCRLSAE